MNRKLLYGGLAAGLVGLGGVLAYNRDSRVSEPVVQTSLPLYSQGGVVHGQKGIKYAFERISLGITRDEVDGMTQAPPSDLLALIDLRQVSGLYDEEGTLLLGPEARREILRTPGRAPVTLIGTKEAWEQREHWQTNISPQYVTDNNPYVTVSQKDLAMKNPEDWLTPFQGEYRANPPSIVTKQR